MSAHISRANKSWKINWTIHHKIRYTFLNIHLSLFHHHIIHARLRPCRELSEQILWVKIDWTFVTWILQFVKVKKFHALSHSPRTSSHPDSKWNKWVERSCNRIWNRIEEIWCWFLTLLNDSEEVCFAKLKLSNYFPIISENTWHAAFDSLMSNVKKTGKEKSHYVMRNANGGLLKFEKQHRTKKTVEMEW